MAIVQEVYDLLRLGTIGAFTGKWVAEDSQKDDCIHTHQYNRKYFDGWHRENNSLRAALQQATRIEAHVRDDHPDVVETKFSFYNGSKKEPFMELTAAFDREGKGGIYHQRGFPEMRLE